MTPDNKKVDLKISLIYFSISVLWILFSDRLANLISINKEMYTDIQNIKGIFFVVMTTAIIYILIRRFLQKIEERLRIENEIKDRLKKSEEKFRTLFENQNVVKMILDPENGKIKEANEASAYKYARNIASLKEMKFEELCVLETDQERNTLESLLNGHEEMPLELRQKTMSGEILDVEIFSSVVDIEQKKYLYCIIVDVTDKKNLERQLTQAQKIESVGLLAGGVAHDFNNILQIILMMGEILENRLDPSNENLRYVKEIIKSSQHASELTRQLLAFARKQTIDPQVLDINERIGIMLKMLKRIIGEDIDLLWEPGENLNHIKIDPSQIDQILANLCINSRDAIDGVGKITIETGMAELDEEYCSQHLGFLPGKYVSLSVSDSGMGMDEETQSKIFEPFFTTKGLGKGTGLGLATIYGIIKQNEGFINVYSEVNQGTTVSLYFPCYEGKDPVKHPEKKEVDIYGKGQKIFLVEDDESIILVVREMLSTLGYKVTTASTPGKALEIINANRSQTWDLLITDVIMPEMTGKELAKRVHEKIPELKVLFMSGYTANVIAHHGVLDKGLHFIQKPFGKVALTEKIKSILEGND